MLSMLAANICSSLSPLPEVPFKRGALREKKFSLSNILVISPRPSWLSEILTLSPTVTISRTRCLFFFK